MQQRLGVAVGLRDALEHQRLCRLIGKACRLVTAHRFIEGIACILAVDLGGHAGEGGLRFLLAAHAMEKPVSP